MKNISYPKALSLCLFLFVSFSLFANTAQPGIRNAGGTGGFTLLFPEDSLAYQKIQMQKERVSIQLYKGFAVVKGEYWMYNETDENITMQSGYPIHASYGTEKEGYTLTEFYFDTLYQMKTYVNGQLLDHTEISYVEQRQNNVESYNYLTDAKWYIWEMNYAANSVTKIDVYFILETNNAKIMQGYNSQYYNSFIYVLETGSTWKPPIGEGTILLQLKDGLSLKDIQGISPENIFHYDESKQTLVYTFQNLEPTKEDNIAITYHEKVDGFNFGNIISKSTAYFSSIDDFSKQSFDTTAKIIEFDSPFDIPDTTGNIFTGIIAVIIIVPLFILGIIIYLIVRYLKMRHK